MKRSRKQSRNSSHKKRPPQKRGPSPQTMRQRALSAGLEYEQKGALLRDHPALQERSREAASATRLATRVIHQRLTLDFLLAKCCSRPQDQVQVPLWQILRQGACELLDPQTDDHAAINETVELARWIGLPKATGFVNGVLRQLQRLRGEREDQAQWTPDRSTLPASSSQIWKLSRPILPDPQLHFEQAVSVVCSLPEELVTVWKAQHNEETVWALGLSSQQETPPCLRINRLKTSLQEYQAQLNEAGIAFETVADCEDMLQLSGQVGISELPGLHDGLISIQDSTASGAVRLLNPQAGESILDLCSAPGTKTVQMAEQMGDEGAILACDVSAARLKRVSENVERCGLQSVKLQVIPREGVTLDQQFDAVVIDAPCSNTGVLGKRPEARWRYSEQSVEELAEIQYSLLDTALAHLKPGGRIVYSTCSIDLRENEQVVEKWKQAHPQWETRSSLFKLPSSEQDGGFATLLQPTS